MGKKFDAARGKVDRAKRYTVEEACQLVHDCKYSKFDESVDLAVRLGVDPKHADQMVRGAIVLPHGTGKNVRVLVFTKGENEKLALAAGADHVGGEELAKKIQDENWLEFDVAIASPDMMPVVSKLGRVLGPRGLMPNPKVGTVTPNVAQAVKEAKAGKIEYRVEKAGIVHAPVGRVSFGPDKLRENVMVLLEALMRVKPASAKGTYFRSVTISSTMGPGVKIDPSVV
ncbi:MAG: 50S ribosomal protein L1, partial [Actinomycetota bacterium]